MRKKPLPFLVGLLVLAASCARAPEDGKADTPLTQEVAAADKRALARERLVREERAFRMTWLPIAGNLESEPLDPLPLRYRPVAEHKEALHKMLKISPVGEYLANEQCHGVLRATGGYPYVHDYLLVTVFFLTRGLVVDTLVYPHLGGLEAKRRDAFRLAIRQPKGSAKRLRVTRTYYGPRIYDQLSRALAENDIDILPSVKPKDYGPRPRRAKRTIPTPERDEPVIRVWMGGPHTYLAGTWRAAIAARGPDDTTWEHSFTAWAPFGLRDQRYIRIFLALARVSPPLAERMRLPDQWRADDPEPQRMETFSGEELPKRPWQTETR